MVAINAIRESNRAVGSTFGPSPTALFVGGTEGIGYSILRQFILNVASPSIIIVGRSETKGKKLIEELKKANAKAKYEVCCLIVFEIAVLLKALDP